MPNPLSKACSVITRGLQELHGFEEVKCTKNHIGWVVTRDAWIGFRWAYVSYVSGCPIDFIRLRNDVVSTFPKTFWRFPIPEIPKFELTVHRSEITHSFVSEFNSFVSFLADGRDEIYTWDIFGDASYPDYGWSVKARELRKRKK